MFKSKFLILKTNFDFSKSVDKLIISSVVQKSELKFEINFLFTYKISNRRIYYYNIKNQNIQRKIMTCNDKFQTHDIVAKIQISRSPKLFKCNARKIWSYFLSFLYVQCSIVIFGIYTYTNTFIQDENYQTSCIIFKQLILHVLVAHVVIRGDRNSKLNEYFTMIVRGYYLD